MQSSEKDTPSGKGATAIQAKWPPKDRNIFPVIPKLPTIPWAYWDALGNRKKPCVTRKKPWTLSTLQPVLLSVEVEGLCAT